MTAPAIIGLTYDAVDVQDLALGIWLEIVAGVGDVPVVRGEDTTIPDAAGSLEGNRIDDYLPIELRGFVRAATSETLLVPSRTSHYDNLLTVRNLFRTNRPRAPLVATLPSGTILTISARPENILPAEIYPGEYTALSIALRGDGDWTVT